MPAHEIAIDPRVGCGCTVPEARHWRWLFRLEVNVRSLLVQKPAVAVLILTGFPKIRARYLTIAEMSRPTLGAAGDDVVRHGALAYFAGGTYGFTSPQSEERNLVS